MLPPTTIVPTHWRLTCFCLATAFLHAAARASADDLPQIAPQAITNLDGQALPLVPTGPAKLTVLIFLGTECPVSNGYAPAMKRLYDAHHQAGVQFVGIHCDEDVSAEDAKTHAAEYGLPFSIALDHSQRLAQACGIHTMPTAVVISPQGAIIYRGRIDNRYLTSGVRRFEATEFDLQDAIAAGLAGKLPARASTEPFGCPIPPPRRKD